MRIAVLTSRYPSPADPYNHMFVHTRNKWYRQLGLDVEVSVYVPSNMQNEYVFEGVSVISAPVDFIIKELRKYDVAFVHLLHVSHSPAYDGGKVFSWMLDNEFPFVIFIHGVEAQSIIKSRPDDLSLLKPRSLVRAVYRDYYLLRRFSNYLNRMLESKSVRIVTPSIWMADDVEFNTGVNIKGQVEVIPNGIDTGHFFYQENLWNNREKVLSIRPLYFKGKYAVDLFLDTADKLRGRGMFSLYGHGPDREIINEQIDRRNLAVSLNGFVNNREIPSIHALHGIYYAVTRMDAQGVSMCEAMSSGLPVISFDVCAIPEFVKDRESGFLVEPYDLVKVMTVIEELWEDRKLFEKISLGARKAAEAIDVRLTAGAEIRLGQTIVK